MNILLRRVVCGRVKLYYNKCLISTDSSSSSSTNKKIVVIGGNGYVGQEVVKAALKAGSDVVSISRSGSPSDFSYDDSSNAATVTWERGDVTDSSSGWQDLINGAHGVISCLGAFGSNEYMEKVNGDANIAAIGAAMAAGVQKFVFVSTAENNLPDFFLEGYFHGKRRAEQALLDAYPAAGAGVILRPGFIYGTRKVPVPASIPIPNAGKSIGLPLSILGRPMEMIFSLPPVKAIRNTVPGMQALLAPPISVEVIGAVAAASAIGSDAVTNCIMTKMKTASSQGLHKDGEVDSAAVNILTIADINKIAESL